MLLEFATFLLKEQSDPRIKRILNTIDLHILVSLNPDGFEKRDGTCEGQAGRNNANDVSFTLQYITVCEESPQGAASGLKSCLFFGGLLMSLPELLSHAIGLKF